MRWLISILFLTNAAFAVVLTPIALRTTLGLTNQGALISLSGVDPLSCPQISMSQTWAGGKLIFSDSPESPSTRGMLYMDTNLTATSAGTPNRIFVYHVNSNSISRMRFSVLIKNNGKAPGTLSVTQWGLAGPSTAYALVGQLAFYRWLTNPAPASVIVPMGATVRLDTNFDSLTVAENFLLNGIWDYTFTQPHTVIICALNPADDPVTVGPTLPVSARDVHERGTFSACNKTYNTANNVVINTAAGIQQFPIAGNGDAFVTGFDNAVAASTAESNGGNYGVLYSMNLATSASDGIDLAFLITPRGGAWSGAVYEPAGLLLGGSVLLPTGGGTFSDETMAALAGEYSPGGGNTIALKFMPTGGASFPVRLMAVPFTAIAPTLSSIGNYQVNVGQTVSFTAAATDANTNKTLAFNLVGAPITATIGTTDGIFHWRPPVSNAGTTNAIRVVVADDSTPPLTNSRTFSISVNPLMTVTVKTPVRTSDQLQFQVNGTIGPDYILQANATLTNLQGWINLSTNSPSASPFNLADTNIASFGTHFYRVLLGP